MTEQKTQEWLDQASSAAIAEAHGAGQLRDLMTTTPPPPPAPGTAPDGQLASTAGMSPGEINEALRAGKLRHYLGG